MIQLQNLSKTFKSEAGQVDALQNINLTIHDGDIYGIIGMSGAGKSTLVRCINLLESPTEGAVLVDGVDLTTLSPAALREERRKIAMIFQHFNLLMQRTCRDNICLPMELAGIPRTQARARAMELLELVGLPDKAPAYPAQLSGGQQQRVAIARALAMEPKVLLCDEATSALDPATTANILSLIRKINRKTGITVVVITHQMSVVEEICNRVAILDHGTVAEEGEVREVFSCPKSPAAKRLVFPDGAADTHVIAGPHERLIRLVFNGGATTGQPLIATLAREHNILANILSASTRSLDGEVFGSVILGISDENDQFDRAFAYLSQLSNVLAEEITEDKVGGDAV